MHLTNVNKWNKSVQTSAVHYSIFSAFFGKSRECNTAIFCLSVEWIIQWLTREDRQSLCSQINQWAHSTWSSAAQNDHRMTSKYRESDKRADGSYAFKSLSRYFDVIRWSFCAVLLQVERAYCYEWIRFGKWSMTHLYCSHHLQYTGLTM